MSVLGSVQQFAKGKERLKRKVLELLAQVKANDKEKDDFTFDESKLIVRELAAELSRVVQITAGKFTRDRRNEEPLDQQGPDKEEKLKEARKALSNWAWTLKCMEQDSVCPGEDVCSVLEDLERQWKRGKLPSMLPVMDFIICSMLQDQRQEVRYKQRHVSCLYEAPLLNYRITRLLILQGSIAKQWFRSRVTLNLIPDSVWKWISKASDKITLDEKTANPNLLLSPDRKRVKMATIIESVYNPWDYYEMTLKMYNGWWCVLGTKGFNSGRHYWEVGVRGKAEWRIGVVRESAPRQGFFDLSPQRGYWTLRLQLGQLIAVTAPITKLNQAVPSKVGVYLDIEEGQVSFYDAAKRRHIYTFDVDFDQSEKIYPLFHTIETDRELVIL
ncbi:E3 ubiquitin-protein ligase TRIM50 [Salmo trutta]|uniref:E3 ubiquitin-protein ligase TRIM50 n=1 Tax=Salmo trutta TaxID=8032 RepID=UPI00113232C2|nr:E3 ubiquitin-protein ligase TRIM50-like [Salmo trutta]